MIIITTTIIKIIINIIKNKNNNYNNNINDNLYNNKDRDDEYNNLVIYIITSQFYTIPFMIIKDKYLLISVNINYNQRVLIRPHNAFAYSAIKVVV